MGLVYQSSNGYKGMLYGESSMSVYGPDGARIFDTKFRNINTLEELQDFVDNYDTMRGGLKDLYKNLSQADIIQQKAEKR